jgi:hypothetical protein
VTRPSSAAEPDPPAPAAASSTATAFGPPAPVSTVIVEIAAQVTDLAPATIDDLPEALGELTAPDGWLAGRVDGQPEVVRAAVAGPQPDRSWSVVETVSAFRFTGIPTSGVIVTHNDRPLRELHADNITTHRLEAPPDPAVTAVRSTGYFTVAGKRTRGQVSTYVAGSRRAGGGLLVEQLLLAEAPWRVRLRDDVDQLTDTVHEAFLAYLDTVEHDAEFPPTPEVTSDGA